MSKPGPRLIPVSSQRRRDDRPLRFGYADPPYPGLAALYPEKTEVDHAELIATLERDYDGWALHTHVPALAQLLPLCPPEVRVLAWVKPWAIFRPGKRLQYAWEPVIVRPLGPPYRWSVFDWLRSVPTRAGRQLKGAKPADVAMYVFDAVGLRPQDELVDLYPGTGAITRAWEEWRRTAAPISGTIRARSMHLWDQQP